MLLLVNEPTVDGTLQQKTLESAQIEIQYPLLVVPEREPDKPSFYRLLAKTSQVSYNLWTFSLWL